MLTTSKFSATHRTHVWFCSIVLGHRLNPRLGARPVDRPRFGVDQRLFLRTMLLTETRGAQRWGSRINVDGERSAPPMVADLIRTYLRRQGLICTSTSTRVF